MNDNGVITAYSGNNIADIVIPSSKNVNGTTVTITGIGDSVFKNHTEIVSVQLPNSLLTIGKDSFMGAGLGTKNVTGNLVIPSSVESIGYSAFEGCPYLGTVTFEDYTGLGEPDAISFSTSFGDSNVFKGCGKLTSIKLSNKTQKLPENFAPESSALKTVEWPEELTSIGDSAFAGDTSLTSSDFSKTKLTTILGSAFSGCTSLPVVVFPDTLVTIGGNAFKGAAMGLKSEAQNLVIPSSVESIGYSAFEGCPYLGTVTFEDYTGLGEPDAISFSTSFGDSNVFKGCGKLTSIKLSNKTQKLPENFAPESTALKTVEWPEELTSIGDSAFAGDTSLTSSDFSKTKLTTILGSAFSGCTSLPVVVFPDTLVTIGGNAFKGAAMGLKSETQNLVIPSSVESIGYSAFEGCPYLGTVTFEDYTGLGEPDAISFSTSIGDSNVFKGCGKLTSIKLSNKTQKLPENFAPYSTALKTVEWPEELTSIGDSAFAGDTSLTSSDLSKTKLTTILGSAFSGCTSLPAVVFPDTLVTIGGRAFNNTAMGTIACGGTVTIPSSVESVGNSAFSNCNYLRKIVIGADNDYLDGMSLGTYMLYPCNYLTEIELSGRIRKIPQEFARDCVGLSHLTVTEKLEEIGNRSFYVNTESGIVVSPKTDVVNNYDWTSDHRKLVDSAVVDVALDKAELSIEAGSNAVLTATTATYPTTATQPTLVWTSDKEAVATVSNTGKVTGKSEGTATITAATEDGRVKAGCIVTVTGSSVSTFTVTFNTNGGSKVEPQAVEKNGKVSKPADPTRDGYTFDGWYEDSALKTKYDFNKPVTGELTLYAKWSEKAEAKEFTLQRDNNHFANSRSDFFGNSGTLGTYQFRNKSYYEKLKKVARDDYDILYLNELIRNRWGGSCYGMAVTMSLALTGRINAGDLTKGSVSNYHDLSKPYTDDVLFDSINFYQSGQLMSAMYDDALIADASKNLNSFLKALVDNTSDGSPVIFCYGCRDYGHAILALNSEKQSDGSYKVTLYDENTASGSSETEHFTYLTVEKDYSGFDYTIVGDGNKLQNVYTRLAIRDPYKYPVFTEIGSGVGTPLYAASAGNGKVLIDLPWDADEITMVNAQNKTLSLKDGETSGDMKVYDVQYIYADEASRAVVTVDRSDYFTYNSNELDASLITDNKTLGISSDTATKARFSLESGNENIEVEGSSYTFDASISSGDSDAILSIQADAIGKTTVSVDGNTITASTDGTIEGRSSTTYIGNDTQEEKLETSDDHKSIWAKYDKLANRSGLDPEPMLTSDSSLYMVKGQAFTLGDGSWSLVGNTKAVALAKKKGTWTLTAKKAGQDSVTNGTVTYKVFVSEPKVIFPDGKKKVKLVIGGIATAKVDGIQDDLISKYPITWVSDKSQVVTLSGNILGATTVNAVGKGSAKVTAYIGGKAYTCNVTVTDDGKNIPKTVSGTGVVAMNPMQSVSLKYSGFNPKGAKWESTDSSNPMKDAEQNKKGETVSVSNGIVMVNTANGKLTAVGEGETTILGTDTSGSKVTLKVTVKAIPSNPVVYLRTGKSAKLSAPKLNSKKAEWKVLRGNEWVQGVDGGKVTAASTLPAKSSSDCAEITCAFKPSTYGNGFNYLYKVYVEEPDLVADSSGNGLKAGAKAGQYTLTLEGGGKYDLSKCYTGIKQPFIWKTSKGAVAYVDEYGTVHANRSGVKGTTKLTAKVNGKSLTVNVTVNLDIG